MAEWDLGNIAENLRGQTNLIRDLQAVQADNREALDDIKETLASLGSMVRDLDEGIQAILDRR